MFLAFAFPIFYPGGGQADFVGAYATMEEATAAALAEDHWDIAQVYDVAAGEWTQVGGKAVAAQ